MNILILTRDVPNHVALCHKLQPLGNLLGIVVSQNIPRKPAPTTWRQIVNRLAGRTVGGPFHAAWASLQARYRQQYPAFPDVPLIQVSNVNDPETLDAIERLKPDLVVVSGTNIVGKTVISAASNRLGVLNLHTGISPYIKGGPNCTNWCLAEDVPHLIGSTVMWLDPGIDTGPIVTTERPDLTGIASLTELHWRVMEHAHDLTVRSVQVLASGLTLPKEPQAAIAPGRTFYTREWTAAAMWKARQHFQRDFAGGFQPTEAFHRRCAEVTLVPLPAAATHSAP